MIMGDDDYYVLPIFDRANTWVMLQKDEVDFMKAKRLVIAHDCLVKPTGFTPVPYLIFRVIDIGLFHGEIKNAHFIETRRGVIPDMVRPLYETENGPLEKVYNDVLSRFRQMVACFMESLA